MMKINWWQDFGDYCGDYVTLSKYTLDYWYIFVYTFRIFAHHWVYQRKKIFFPPLSYIWQTTVPEAIKEFVTKGKSKRRNKLIKYGGNEMPFDVSLWLVVGSYLLHIMVLLTKARFWDWSMVINNIMQYQGIQWKYELMLQRPSK